MSRSEGKEEGWREGGVAKGRRGGVKGRRRGEGKEEGRREGGGANGRSEGGGKEGRG